MGIVGKFERTLQGAVGDAFARLFGGRVVAAEVESQLRKQAEASLKVVDGHLLVSNSYTITLARSDYASFTEDEALAVKTFSRHLSDHISEQGWETYGPVTVTFVERDDLHTGQMRIDGVVDPDAVPFHISAAAPAPAPDHPAPSSPGGDRRGVDGPSASKENSDMQAPASNYPVSTGPGARSAGWGGPSDAPTQITQGRASLTVTLHLEDGSGRTFRLQRGSNLLGRGQDAAFRLPDTGVSRQHADIHFDGREAVLTDLGSTNGTTVNDGPIQDWQLADGDVIRVGHSEITVRFD
ncbi:FHA domain-containing protein [Dietzia kunjamensis subsp. schimae]|uniref:FHA domain-containing protein n=1 Tax=Dietzia kunjamensis subsp. schimae TaxID=498198 RepID=A0ABY1N4Z1_9ACTN|nr:DUF3662 and FHA domain-containing protein [Dietzia kunjamensis]MBB1014369.1 DUF3662 domain-containing protein [Dietzia kunjamensis subsp. schimae]MDJ0423883.1 DUF3662 and FHA domain-containing protein [Dietzia kunjamensis]SMO88761.1 FHA domain-containing protein [Dietzia kunjamensis subsp. schimae]